MRPQRQARSSVSYKDNLSDDDDFSMPVGRSSRKPSSHKKNAVEEEQRATTQQKGSGPKRKERPNPKERAEAMQLERAIKESLNDADRQGTKVSEPSSPRPPFRGFHLDAYRSNIHRPSVAFQCLLDVASEEDGSGAQDETALENHSQQEKDEPQISSGSLTTSDQVDSLVCANEAPEQPTADAANLENGFRQELEEKYSRDTSRHKEVRKRSGSIEDTEEDQDEEDSSSSESNLGASRKARRLVTKDSSSTTGAMSRNTVLDANVAKDALGQQEPVSKESKQRIWLAQHSPSNAVESEVRKPGMSQPPATESSGLLLSVQSSSLPHRRVVGLSRRFRPPPLHPYLLG